VLQLRDVFTRYATDVRGGDVIASTRVVMTIAIRSLLLGCACGAVHSRAETRLLPGMVLALGMPLELIAVEVDLAQVAGRVAAGFVIEMR
jgi:hypothetical protein